MNLRKKIFFSLSTLALVPLILITWISYSRYVSTTYERMNELSQNMFDNALDEANSRIASIENAAGLFTFYSDSDFSIVQNLKQFSNPTSIPDYYDTLKANNNIKFVCQNILYSYDYIYGLYVFTPSGAVLSHTNGQDGDLLSNYDPTGEDWYEKTIDLSGQFYISSITDHPMFSGEKKTLFFSKALYDVYTHEFLGILLIDCNPDLFNINNINTMPDIANFTIIDSEHNSTLYTCESSSLPADTGNSLVKKNADLSLNCLKLSATFNYEILYKEYSFTGMLLLAAASICSILILLVSFILSRSITKPIEHLSHKMANQNGSHLVVSGKYLNRNDEIGTLYNEYNSMVEELNFSIKKDYKDRLITLDAQMRSLEAQINSHFLFNTLESINSLAELEDNSEISTMVYSLGNMFRYSIKTQSELVTIEDEISHVNNYISIQEIRFDHKFKFINKIPESMYHQKILKLILQPLVENSLYHGLNYCATGDSIELSGECDDRYIHITLTDNGAGMTNQELFLLNEKLHEKASFSELGHRTGESIGLKNICSRIELYYGVGYGLTITSVENRGTSISILLPLLESSTPQ